MASWYERSSTWRRIVAVTKQSSGAMAAFTVVCFGVPYVLGKGVMWLSNPREDSALERQLRERSTMDHKVRLWSVSAYPIQQNDHVVQYQPKGYCFLPLFLAFFAIKWVLDMRFCARV